MTQPDPRRPRSKLLNAALAGITMLLIGALLAQGLRTFLPEAAEKPPPRAQRVGAEDRDAQQAAPVERDEDREAVPQPAEEEVASGTDSEATRPSPRRARRAPPAAPSRPAPAPLERPTRAAASRNPEARNRSATTPESRPRQAPGEPAPSARTGRPPPELARAPVGSESRPQSPERPATPPPPVRPAPSRPDGKTTAAKREDGFRSVQAAPASVFKPTYKTALLRAGTKLNVRLAQRLRSDTNSVGETFRATLNKPLPLEGGISVARGALVTGTVVSALRSGRVKGRARMALDLHTLAYKGWNHAIRTETVDFQAKATRSRDAVKIGIAAGVGAIIGGLLDGESGAARGAAIGGAAGGAGALATRGKEVDLSPEQEIRFKLKEDIRLPLGSAQLYAGVIRGNAMIPFAKYADGAWTTAWPPSFDDDERPLPAVAKEVPANWHYRTQTGIVGKLELEQMGIAKLRCESNWAYKLGVARDEPLIAFSDRTTGYDRSQTGVDLASVPQALGLSASRGGAQAAGPRALRLVTLDGKTYAFIHATAPEAESIAVWEFQPTRRKLLEFRIGGC